MHLPFSFSFVPAAPAAVFYGEPWLSDGTANANALLSALVTGGRQVESKLKPTIDRTVTLPVWVRELAITADHGVTVSVGYLSTDTNKYVLWTTHGAGAGNGGHTQQFGGDGLYIPKNLRLIVTAGADADNATTFTVSGHFDLVELPS